jgi:hypothetical protein
MLTLLLFSLIAAAESQNDRSPQQVVEYVVKHDDWGSKNPELFADHTTPAMRENFTKSFIKHWERALKKNQSTPVLDGDILTWRQNISRVKLNSAVGKKAKGPNQAIVEADLSFSNEDDGLESKVVRFVLKKESGAWKIDDFYSREKDTKGHAGQRSFKAYAATAESE